MIVGGATVPGPSDGGVVDADVDRTLDGTPVDEVVFELLRFESGNFAFDGDDTAAASGEPEDVEAAPAPGPALCLLGEWNDARGRRSCCWSTRLRSPALTCGLNQGDRSSAHSWQSLVAVVLGAYRGRTGHRTRAH